LATVSEIVAAHRRAGGLFFDPEHAQAVELVVRPAVRIVKGGTLFLTSQLHSGRGCTHYWTVRLALPDGFIGNASPEGGSVRYDSAFSSMRGIHKRALEQGLVAEDLLLDWRAPNRP